MKAILYMNLFINFIINKELIECLSHHTSQGTHHLENDCWKEPQELQKEGPKEEGVSNRCS
jgi:hypothetical protein